MIERYRSSADRRVLHTRLTRPGRDVLREAPSLLHERYVRAFAALGSAKQDKLIRTLKEVAEMMGAERLDAASLLDTTLSSSVDKPDAHA